MKICAALALAIAIGLPAPAAAQYAARRDGDVVRLQDSRTDTTVSIVPSVGNIAFELKVKGRDVLHWPFASLDEFKARPGLSGIPFVGPWIDRLDEQAFFFNGRKYAFDMGLGNVRGAIPIHGFLTTNTHWEVVEVKADANAAWATSRLEFFRQPAWMKQWPFAHTIEITHRLADGALEVRTRIVNQSDETMPIAVGFHPYFRLPGSPRDQWTIAVAARTHWLLTPQKIPSGETEPIDRFLPKPSAAPLAEYNLDDVFGDLVRDPQGRATMSVSGGSERLDVVIGPNYRAVVIWAPKGSTFICIEPMAGITDAVNLAQKGVYKELQTVAPRGTWEESFWIRPRGF